MRRFFVVMLLFFGIYFVFGITSTKACFVGPDGECVYPDNEGGSFATATKLNLDSSKKAYVSFSNDVDYFKYTVSYTNWIKLSVTGISTIIRVYNQDSLTTPIKTFYGNSGDFDIYANKGETYYFKVSAAISGSMGEYYMNLKDDCQCNNDPLIYTIPNSHGYLPYYSGTKTIRVFIADTEYRQLILQAMGIWNSAGEWQFVETTSSNFDIKVTNDEDTHYAEYRPYVFIEDIISGYDLIMRAYIEYNPSLFSNMNDSERLDTLVHEFGHALGLYEMNREDDYFYNGGYFTNVMTQDVDEFHYLGKCDLATYHYLEENIY